MGVLPGNTEDVLGGLAQLIVGPAFVGWDTQHEIKAELIEEGLSS